MGKIAPIAAFFPISALLHHAVFFRPTCILNNLGVKDYSWDVVKTLVFADPSFSIAALLSVAVYMACRASPLFQTLTWYFVASFIPLTLWIWDIPLAERVICFTFHDGRTGIQSRHLYVLGSVIFATLVITRMRRAHSAP